MRKKLFQKNIFFRRFFLNATASTIAVEIFWLLWFFQKFFHISQNIILCLNWTDFFRFFFFTRAFARCFMEFLTKKLRMWIWSQTSSRNTNTTHFGSDCHITGNQIFFGWKKFIDFFSRIDYLSLLSFE